MNEDKCSSSKSTGRLNGLLLYSPVKFSCITGMSAAYGCFFLSWQGEDATADHYDIHHMMFMGLSHDFHHLEARLEPQKETQVLAAG